MQNKSGVKTTEFWVTLISFLTGMGVSLGYIQPQDQVHLDTAIVQIVGAFLAVLPPILYIYSRFILKKNVQYLPVVPAVVTTPEVVSEEDTPPLVSTNTTATVEELINGDSPQN